MIQIGTKEEIALLLALFGTHTQPKPKSSRRSTGSRADGRQV